MCDILNIIGQWQTLISGVLALSAAFIGASFLWFQINQIEGHEQERRRGRRAAARAASPLSLAMLTDYLLACGRELRRLHGQKVGGLILRSALVGFQRPELPSDVVKHFQDVVETSDEKIGGDFAKILAKVQVQRSRLQSMSQRFGEGESHAMTQSELEDYIVDVADIYRRCNKLFKYARGDAETLEESAEGDGGVHGALHLMGYREPEFLQLFATVNFRIDGGRL